MIEQNCQKLNESAGASKGKRSYTVKEITEILGISPSSAVKLIKANMFRSIRVGREVRIPKADFDAWLEKEKISIPSFTLIKMKRERNGRNGKPLRPMQKPKNEKQRLNFNRNQELLLFPKQKLSENCLRITHLSMV